MHTLCKSACLSLQSARHLPRSVLQAKIEKVQIQESEPRGGRRGPGGFSAGSWPFQIIFEAHALQKPPFIAQKCATSSHVGSARENWKSAAPKCAARGGKEPAVSRLDRGRFS